MTEDVNASQNYGSLSAVGVNPIASFVLLLLHHNKKIIREEKDIILSIGISSFLTWSGIVFGISYAASKDLKLSGIIAGSLAAAVLLFQVSDFSIRRIKGESTGDAIIYSVADTGIIYGLTTGVVVAPALGMDVLSLIEKCQ
ncbi:MAG: hypothetical protein HRK26_00885 [Rickettsiaceae bacterium H1]|nr:hypothetical protein [Rickettsiaceae bacterium H1]